MKQGVNVKMINFSVLILTIRDISSPHFHVMSSSSCNSVTLVFKVTEPPSITDTECLSFVSSPDDHEDV